MCEERLLKTVKDFNDGSLVIDEELVKSFASMPLKSLGLDKYIGYLTRVELSRDPVSDQLPFDVSMHHQSHSEVALSMIRRLQADMTIHADIVNNGKTPKFLMVLDDDARAFVASKDPAKLQHAIDEITRLIEALLKLRDKDMEYVNGSIPYSLDKANEVPDIMKEDTPNRAEVCRYVLNRFSGQETHICKYLI